MDIALICCQGKIFDAVNGIFSSHYSKVECTISKLSVK
jgi:hypothetical protein